jgi:hypothetical protein
LLAAANSFIAFDATAVLRWSRSIPIEADRRRHVRSVREHGLEDDRVLPVVAEVVAVEQGVARIDQQFVELDLVLGHPGLVAVLSHVRAQVVLGEWIVIAWPASELVQMAVGPADRRLDHLVHLVEKQLRGQLDPPPELRCGVVEVDADSVRGSDTASRVRLRRWGGGSSRRRNWSSSFTGSPYRIGSGHLLGTCGAE